MDRPELLATGPYPDTGRRALAHDYHLHLLSSGVSLGPGWMSWRTRRRSTRCFGAFVVLYPHHANGTRETRRAIG